MNIKDKNGSTITLSATSVNYQDVLTMEVVINNTVELLELTRDQARDLAHGLYTISKEMKG